MTPVIRHLRATFAELPLIAEQGSFNWTFDERIQKLGPDFYKKIIPIHPLLNIEYSVVCHQLHHNFLFPQGITPGQIRTRLIAALMLAELLEHVYLYYLDVPREVVRLRRHQKIFKELLRDISDYSFSNKLPSIERVDVGLSLSQYIRENTLFSNWYRLFIIRTKRALDLLDVVVTGLPLYRNFVAVMDKYMNPILVHVGWGFYFPRLVTNLYLLFKHVIPWPSLSNEEKALGWFVRLESQLQRRWFELGNDSMWVFVGLINGFILTGVLAPIGLYLTISAFAYDVVIAALRAYIELNRLFELRQQYTDMYNGEENEEYKKEITNYQRYLDNRIHFEILRFSLHVAGTVAIFLAMALAIPALALNPIVPFVGAVWLVVICAGSYTLTQVLEHYRPVDAVEKPSGVTALGFFAKKAPIESSIPESNKKSDTSSTFSPTGMEI